MDDRISESPRLSWRPVHVSQAGIAGLLNGAYWFASASAGGTLNRLGFHGDWCVGVSRDGVSLVLHCTSAHG